MNMKNIEISGFDDLGSWIWSRGKCNIPDFGDPGSRISNGWELHMARPSATFQQPVAVKSGTKHKTQA